MQSIKYTYGQIYKGCLLLAFIFAFTTGKADDTQTLISLSAQTMGSTIGDAAPSIAYNPTKNEYLLVYTDFDGACPTNQELRGQIINAITGEKSGNVLNLTISEQPCSTHSIIDPKVVYNELEDEFLILFKSSTALGAKIKYLSLDANNLLVSSSIMIDEDEIADPFKNCELELDESSNIYAIAYHTENALSESLLKLKFVNGSTKSILAYSVQLDKSNFVAGNKGVFGSKLLYNNENIMVAFEARFTAGSEIHGAFINSLTGAIIGDIFQISPSGTASTNYMNPALAFNENSGEILVVYEEARVISGNYALNYKIDGQKINSSTGSLIAPTSQSLTEVPITSSPYTEESKLSSVCYSEISQEYIISFYGVRYAAGTDIYNVYFQRVKAEDISAINSTSTLVINTVGTQVVENNSLRSLPLSFNTTNNQFLFGWNTETTNNVQTQIWRYDNNAPTNLSLSNTTQNENQAIGSTFGTFSASDPDPEDGSPTFTLASGAGGEDNAFFTIEGNKLLIEKILNYEESTTRNIRIRTTDSHGKFIEKTFSLTINNVNEVPTSLTILQPISVEENLNAGSFSTSISAEDDDIGDTHTFTLVAGDSSDNNSNFEIAVGSNILTLIQPLSFEDTSKQYVRIRATDTGDSFIEKAFVVDVIDVNEQPFNLTLSQPVSAEENLTAGSFSTTISVEDDDLGETHTFTLVAGDSSNNNSNFEIAVGSNTLTLIQPLSFEDTSKQYVRIRASDTGNSFIEKAFVIDVIDVNEQPFNLSILQPVSIEENLTAGSFSTTISVEDDDFGETHIFTLVVGDSSNNNLNFEIATGSNILTIIEPLNFEDTSRQYVRIRATDTGNSFIEKAFVVDVIDVNEQPESIVLSSGTLPENDSNCTIDIDVIDQDLLSDYTFSFSTGDGDTDNSLFSLVENTLKPNAVLNFEEKDSYSIRLHATDGTHSISDKFLLTVSDKNDAPDSVGITVDSLADNKGAGYTIGKLVTYDEDVSDEHVLELISGGDLFLVDNLDNLITRSSLMYSYTDPSKNRYDLTVKSTDQNDEFVTTQITIHVFPNIDTVPPVILDFTTVKFFQESPDSTIHFTIQVPADEQLGSIEFFYQGIRSSNSSYLVTDSFQLEEVNDRFNIDVALNDSILDEMGIEYYFKVTDASGNSSTTDIGYTYRSFATKDFDATQGIFNGTAESYKIISNPYATENNRVLKVFAEYGLPGIDSWRLFNYANKKTNEMSANSDATLKQGKGYWFNKVESLDQQILLDNASVQENNRNNLFVMALEQGWNLIGNPYPFDIHWNDVLLYNSLSEDEIILYTFNKSYQVSTILDEFEGGFVYVDNPISLKIPLSISSTNGRIAKDNKFENGWLINLALDNGSLKNEFGGIGMHELAKSSYDKFDRPLLPRFINHLDISFNHPEHFSNVFTRDIVEMRDNYIWEFVASTNHTNKNITLNWTSENTENSTKILMLYDVLHNKTINMSTESEYVFTADEPVTFKAIYGDEAFVKDALSKMQIEALKAYPNPFNEAVTIPVNLPYSNGSYTIEFKMYNLMGERVSERKLENIDHGLYQLNLVDDQHRKLKQGIYIYSIKVRNGYLTNNFHGRVVKD